MGSNFPLTNERTTTNTADDLHHIDNPHRCSGALSRRYLDPEQDDLIEGADSIGLRSRPAGAHGRARLIVVGIWMNEAVQRNEWLTHYLVHEGASRILLIDIGSTDKWRKRVAPFADHVTVISRPEQHKQISHYNAWLSTLKK